VNAVLAAPLEVPSDEDAALARAKRGLAGAVLSKDPAAAAAAELEFKAAMRDLFDINYQRALRAAVVPS
jgi:hypothetical protein